MDNEMNNVVDFEKTENKKDKVVNWIKDHKKEILIGTGIAVTAILTVVICKKAGSSKVDVSELTSDIVIPELPEDKVDYNALIQDIYCDTGADMYNSIIDETVDSWNFEETYKLENCSKKLVINVEKVINE